MIPLVVSLVGLVVCVGAGWFGVKLFTAVMDKKVREAVAEDAETFGDRETID